LHPGVVGEGQYRIQRLDYFPANKPCSLETENFAKRRQGIYVIGVSATKTNDLLGSELQDLLDIALEFEPFITVDAGMNPVQA
jgi:hypothetical protein